MEGPLLHVLLRQLQQGLLGRAGSHQHSVHNGVVLPGGGAGGGCQASWEAATRPCPPLLPVLGQSTGVSASASFPPKKSQS